VEYPKRITDLIHRPLRNVTVILKVFSEWAHGPFKKISMGHAIIVNEINFQHNNA
jgi:hypothetical protein